MFVFFVSLNTDYEYELWFSKDALDEFLSTAIVKSHTGAHSHSCNIYISLFNIYSSALNSSLTNHHSLTFIYIYIYIYIYHTYTSTLIFTRRSLAPIKPPECGRPKYSIYPFRIRSESRGGNKTPRRRECWGNGRDGRSARFVIL